MDMLENKVSKLQEKLDCFKELWNKFIKFLQDKFFSSNKYDDLIDELHEKDLEVYKMSLVVIIRKIVIYNDNYMI